MSFEKQSMKAKKLGVCMDCYEGRQDLGHVSGWAGEHTHSGACITIKSIRTRELLDVRKDSTIIRLINVCILI